MHAGGGLVRLAISPASRLEMRRNQTLLVTYKLEVDPDGQPVTYGESCFRGYRVNLVIESTG